MRNEIINIKTDSATKKQARKIAEKLGLSLSTVINGYLKQFIRNQEANFSAEPNEKPSQWLISELRQAKRDEEQGYVSPAFDDTLGAVEWLKNRKSKYINGKWQ